MSIKYYPHLVLQRRSPMAFSLISRTPRLKRIAEVGLKLVSYLRKRTDAPLQLRRRNLTRIHFDPTYAAMPSPGLADGKGIPR
jgi:hypothetical protein